MLEELGIPYHVTILSREERRSPEHRKRHPLGRVPVLELDDGRFLIESAAICLYLADSNPVPELIPPSGSVERGLAYQWVMFAMTELEPPVLGWARARDEGRDETEFAQRYLSAAAVLDSALVDREWLLGSFSVVDVVCAGVAGVFRTADAADHPSRIQDYIDRARARPANQRARALGT